MLHVVDLLYYPLPRWLTSNFLEEFIIMKLFWVALTVLAQAPWLVFTQNTTDQPTVDLGYASYAGTDLGNGVSQFLGMRFAKPPLGDMRFAAPQPPDVETNGTVQATEVCCFRRWHILYYV